MARLTREQLEDRTAQKVIELAGRIADLKRELESVKGERNTIREAANGLADEVTELRACVAPGPCGKPGHTMSAWREDHHHCCQLIETNGTQPCDCHESYCTLCAQREAAVADAWHEGYDEAQQEAVAKTDGILQKRIAAAEDCAAGVNAIPMQNIANNLRAALEEIRALIPSSAGAQGSSDYKSARRTLAQKYADDCGYDLELMPTGDGGMGDREPTRSPIQPPSEGEK